MTFQPFRSFLLTGILTLFSIVSGFSQDEHIGRWKAEEEGEVIYITLDSTGYVTMIIEGDTLGGPSFDMDGEEGYMLYDVTYGKPFNTIDFHIMSKEYDMLIAMLPGIFKFDEKHRLVLCMNFESADRPQAFVEDDMIVLDKMTE